LVRLKKVNTDQVIKATKGQKWRLHPAYRSRLVNALKKGKSAASARKADHKKELKKSVMKRKSAVKMSPNAKKVKAKKALKAKKASVRKSAAKVSKKAKD
jgi:hypothetical protein